MAAESFERALDLVLRHEGLWADHPADPGGATMKGVTLRTYEEYLGRDVSKAELKAIPLAHIRDIYRAGYWNKIHGDDLPAGLDYCAFDAAVNSGPRRAARWLQQAVFAAVDGEIGEQTLAAARSANVPWAIRRMARIRIDFLKRLSTWRHFGRGWERRVEDMERDALRMTDGTATAHSAPETGDGPVLRQGDRGEDVRALQAALADYGLRLVVDGDFGPKTAYAVRLFQMDHGLKPDSICGPNTWAALDN